MTDEDPIDGVEAGADGVSPPPTPEGYGDPYRFEYLGLLLFASASVLTVVSVVVYGWLLIQLQGPEIRPVAFEVGAVEELAIVFNLGQVAVPFLFAFLVVAVVHELLHGVVYRRSRPSASGLDPEAVHQRHGYDVSYGVYWRMGVVYAAVFHQFHSREDNLRVGIAPMTVMSSPPATMGATAPV